MKKLNFLILVLVFTLAIPLYAQNEESLTRVSPPTKERPDSFLDFIDKKAYASVVDEEEKRILREEWRKFLGIDIFYPYYKTKEIEEWVSKKVSIEFFNIKGKPEFEANQIRYIFKIKF